MDIANDQKKRKRYVMVATLPKEKPKNNLSSMESRLASVDSEIRAKKRLLDAENLRHEVEKGKLESLIASLQFEKRRLVCDISDLQLEMAKR